MCPVCPSQKPYKVLVMLSVLQHSEGKDCYIMRTFPCVLMPRKTRLHSVLFTYLTYPWREVNHRSTVPAHHHLLSADIEDIDRSYSGTLYQLQRRVTLVDIRTNISCQVLTANETDYIRMQ
jgi:hypothetical protein